MPYIQAGKEDGKPVNIFYEDWGIGKPVVLIHGWPVSHEMWEYQATQLVKQGLRCIVYDRRGFGKSDKPIEGYDYDCMAKDLKALLEQLNLQEVTLVGFSMGGGEVIRYCSLYGAERVEKIVLISSVTPFLLQTDTNPDGVEKEVFDGMLEQLQEDRPAFLNNFGKQFFGVEWMSHPVSDGILQWMQNLALAASPVATIACLHAFSETDFRDEMQHINLPALVIHGDSDKTVPVDASGRHTAGLLSGSVFKIYQGAPHGLFITQKQQLTEDLVSFINNGSVMDFIPDAEREISVF